MTCCIIKLKKKQNKKKTTCLPVPVQSLLVEAVKKVRLGADGSHVRMDAQELQQSPGATFLHPDDDGLRELFAAEIIRYRDVVRWSVAVRQVRQLFPDNLRRVIRAELLLLRRRRSVSIV